MEVWASWGQVTPQSIAGLSALEPEEIPPGYGRWVEKRQREYRAGRHHARAALAAAGLERAQVRRGEDGLPLFPAGYHGTISHTGRLQTWAAAVVASAPHRIGLDVEERRALSEGMIRTVLSPEERRMWAGRLPLRLAGAEFTEAEAALLAFSMKEAFYKTVSPVTGIYLGFHDVAVALGAEPGSFTARLARAHPEHEGAGGPPALTGRFQLSEAHVACGVTWQR